MQYDPKTLPKIELKLYIDCVKDRIEKAIQKPEFQSEFEQWAQTEQGKRLTGLSDDKRRIVSVQSLDFPPAKRLFNCLLSN